MLQSGRGSRGRGGCFDCLTGCSGVWVFAVLYGFGEHNNKKLCPLFMQINERIENVLISPKKSKSNLKIPFVNFGCGLLPIAISILGNLVSNF